MQACVFHARPLAALILSFLFIASFPIAAKAAVLNVPSQFATIGAAVSAASNGDTIQVDSSGSPYSGESILTSKALTIQSVSGAASTAIDCSNGNNFGTFQGSGTTIQGFTFKNSSSSQGVIDCQTSMTIQNCVFTNNNSGFNFNPSCINTAGSSNTVNVVNCTFSSNTGLGAIQVNSILDVSNCSFSNNLGAFGSGAIYANTATGTITNCTFTNNTSDNGDQGGAVYWVNGGVSFADCTFTGNSSAAAGGAVEVGSQGLNSPSTFTRCLFSENSAPYGGAIGANISSNHSTTVTATDCVFIGNDGSTDEAAVGSHGNAVPLSINLVNCSFFGNTHSGASNSTSGTIGGDGQTTLTVANCILFGDTTPKEISTGNVANSTAISSTDSADGVTNGVNGNIDADPKYAGPAANDLHLLSSSPCVQAGTATGAPTTDFNQYTWGSTVSMGAFSPIHFDITVPSTATAGSSFSFTTTAIAADDTTTITNFADTLHFTSTDAAASLPIDSTLTNGVETLSATLNTPGSQTITATDTSTTAITGTSAGIVVAAQVGPATHFLITAPTTATDVQSFSFTVTALDNNGNTDTNYGGTIHFSSSDGSASLPTDSTLTSGVGTFSATLRHIGAQTITGMDVVVSSIAGTSNTITVSAGPATSFFITAPSSATAGTPFSFSVAAFDALGNTAHSYSGTVHFTSTDGLASLPADATLTSGHGDFNATLNTLGNQSITATDTVNSSITGTTGTIDVTTSAVLTTFPAGLQMISAPSDYSAFSVSQIFNPGNVQLAVWLPLFSTYAITPTTPADTVRPGQGYWARFATTTSLLDTGQHVNETNPFSIPLQTGWNMIGDPFAENIPLNQLVIVVNGHSQGFPTHAHPRGAVMDQLFTLPAGATHYQIETQTLKTFTGYWLFAFEPCTLIVPAR